MNAGPVAMKCITGKENIVFGLSAIFTFISILSRTTKQNSWLENAYMRK